MGGWWRLDEVIEPSLQLVYSRAQRVVPVAPTPIEVEAYDIEQGIGIPTIESRASTIPLDKGN